jgi:hypothetical protein
MSLVDDAPPDSGHVLNRSEVQRTRRNLAWCLGLTLAVVGIFGNFVPPRLSYVKLEGPAAVAAEGAWSRPPSLVALLLVMSFLFASQTLGRWPFFVYGLMGDVLLQVRCILAARNDADFDSHFQAAGFWGGLLEAGVVALLCAGAADLRITLRRAAESPEDKPPRLQFRLFHLLIITAVAAVYFAISARLWPSASNLDAVRRIFIARMFIGGGAFVGSFAGAMLVAQIRWRGDVFPRHPGDYLLAIAILDQFLGFCRILATRSSSFPELTGVELGVLVVAIYATREWRWRAVLTLFLVEHLLKMSPFLFESRRTHDYFGLLLTFVYYAGIPLLETGALIGLSASEWWRRVQRPWTHWLGVALFLWAQLAQLILMASFIWQS